LASRFNQIICRAMSRQKKSSQYINRRKAVDSKTKI
jgi:hypothetical protein